jgi:hypothetical protein
MANLSHIVSQLQAQRKRVHTERGRLDAAIVALRGRNTSSGPGAIRASSARPRRTMSAAARRKIAAAQKKRWAVWKAKRKKSA